MPEVIDRARDTQYKPDVSDQHLKFPCFFFKWMVIISKSSGCELWRLSRVWLMFRWTNHTSSKIATMLNDVSMNKYIEWLKNWAPCLFILEGISILMASKRMITSSFESSISHRNVQARRPQRSDRLPSFELASWSLLGIHSQSNHALKPNALVHILYIGDKLSKLTVNNREFRGLTSLWICSVTMTTFRKDSYGPDSRV
jgi:hypothetical protein